MKLEDNEIYKQIKQMEAHKEYMDLNQWLEWKLQLLILEVKEG